MRISFAGGEEMDIEVSPGEPVAEAMKRAGAGLVGLCRGHGRCGMCVVAVHEGMESLSAASEAEARALRLLGAKPNQRLACQASGQ